MEYVGIDWGYGRAAWCARLPGGDIVAEGLVPADADGLLRLVHRLGPEVKGCVEMMSGAVWVRDQLAACGWQIEIADARKAKALAPLAAKTDKVDARLLAELARRDLVPALWVPSLSERELRERLRRRMHLVRLRTSAKGRIFGLLTQWGVRIKLTRLRQPDGLELLERRGVPEVWRRSVAEALGVIDELDRRVEPLDRELAPLADADRRVALLETIPGVGPAARTHPYSRDRRHRPLRLRAQAGRLLRPLATRTPVGQVGAHRGALEERPQDAALGGGRGSPIRLASVQPLAPPLQRRRLPPRLRPGQGRRRPQSPGRRLARPRPQRNLQALPPPRRHCRGQAPSRLW